MSRERRLEKLARSSRFHHWVDEMNDILRAKVISKERKILGFSPEFDIENNTGYLLDIEITDDGLIVISEVETETTKEATNGTNRAKPKTCACDCK